MIAKILLYIYAFYIIFQPEFTFIHPLLQPGVLILVIMFLNIILLNKKLLNLIDRNNIIPLFVILIFLLAHIIFRNLYFGFNISNFLSNILIFAHIINFLSLIIWYIKIYEISEPKSYIKFIVNLGIVQSILIFSMLIIPSFKEVANVFYSQNEVLPLNLSSILNYRVYGIGSSYTFMLPLTLTLISILALHLFFKYSELKHLFFSLIIVLASSFNGRTGVYIYIIIFMIYFCTYILHKMTIYQILLLINIMIIFFFAFIIVNTYFPDRISWVFEGLEAIILYFRTGETVGNLEVLAREYWIFPSGVYFFIGTGQRVIGANGQLNFGMSSDIGYVNDLFKGGIFYLVILYASQLKYSFNRIKSKILRVSLLIFLLISNYKGEVMTGSILIMLIFSIGFINHYYHNFSKANTMANDIDRMI